jgi:hypothetical protein
MYKRTVLPDFYGRGPIKPPTEYPIVFVLDFRQITVALPERIRNSYIELVQNVYLQRKSESLSDFIIAVKKEYAEFLTILKKELFTYAYYTDWQINDNLDRVYKEARDGDIIEFGSDNYYIYGKGDNRKILLLLSTNNPSGYVFPMKGLNALKHYNIHSYRDMEKYYPYTIFSWIEIPKKYYPPQLYNIANPVLDFIITNKNGIEYQRGLPVIPLNIGDESDYIIYVYLPSGSPFYDYFADVPEYKI